MICLSSAGNLVWLEVLKIWSFLKISRKRVNGLVIWKKGWIKRTQAKLGKIATKLEKSLPSWIHFSTECVSKSVAIGKMNTIPIQAACTLLSNPFVLLDDKSSSTTQNHFHQSILILHHVLQNIFYSATLLKNSICFFFSNQVVSIPFPKEMYIFHFKKTLQQTCFQEKIPLKAQLAFKDSMIHENLQFTLHFAFCRVLHRQESRDIHRWELFLK